MIGLGDYQLIIIGAGLSGLAAGIRAARFGQKVLILEQHSLAGGLNSYYCRKGFLLETGLHAMTNFARSGDKRAPLNRLFRQLQISRKEFQAHEQLGSKILFKDHALNFTNDVSVLRGEIAREFPAAAAKFSTLLQLVEQYDPFAIVPWRSTRHTLAAILENPILEDMLLLPLMVYGNSEEYDMDFGQFVIMFRAVFREGFFRPAGTIKDFLHFLLERYTQYGGEIRYRAQVKALVTAGERVRAVVLASGEELACSAVLCTAGLPALAQLTGWPHEVERYRGRMSFMESIAIVPRASTPHPDNNHTIIFYNTANQFSYRRPAAAVEPAWGVICFPENFQGLPATDHFQVRVTNAANHELWRQSAPDHYQQLKEQWLSQSRQVVGTIIGNYWQQAVYQDCFTPLTIERFTAKAAGAVYGSPLKIKDGRTPWDNLFLAGTDQGYLGIVGSMLSGVSMVNQHLLQ